MAHDPVRAALAPLIPETGRNDWDDVLRRVARRPRRGLRLVLVPALCLLVTVPALAASRSFHGLIGSDPRPRLSAALRTPGGAEVGRLDLEVKGALWPTNGRGPIRPRRFSPVGHGPFSRTFPVRWTLELRGLGGRADRGTLSIVPGRVAAGRAVATVCRSCRDGDGGTLHLKVAQTMALLNGHLVFTLATSQSQRAAAGPVLLPRRG